MAEHASLPPLAPPPHDWEVLSISMSSSTFGSSSVHSRDPVNGAPHSASEVSLPAAVNQTPSASNEESPLQLDEPDNSIEVFTGTGASGSGLLFMNCEELLSVGSRSDMGVEAQKIAVVSTSDVEPFTDGWKPRIGTAVVGDQGYGNCQNIVDVGHNYYQGDYDEGIRTANEDTEPLGGLQKEMFMGEEFVLRERISNLTDDKVARKKVRKDQSKASWWMWQTQSRKSSAMWSIALAATVVGIVIIGHRLQQERCQNQQLRFELSAKNEKLHDLLTQVNRLKAVVTGHHRVPVMRGSSF